MAETSDEPEAPAATKTFCELTGSDVATAERMLAACNDDLDAAVALFFEGDDGDSDHGEDGDGDSAAAMDSSAGGSVPGSEAGGLADMAADLVSNLLKNARSEGGEEGGVRWGAGRTLGSSGDAAADSADAADEPEETGPPIKAKSVRVIFWANGFTVEDVSAEEAAVPTPSPAAPRRTGLATLNDTRSAQPPEGMMSVPELRSYAENAQFMSDLQRGIPPLELREIDLSTGTPRPRPVEIQVGDLRKQKFPAEAAKKLAASARSATESAARSSAPLPFSGEGRSLGSTSVTETTTPPEDGPAGSEWPHAGRAAPEADGSMPTTEMQVRFAGSAAPQRLRLNHSHTVLDVKVLVEIALHAAGEAPRPYVLQAGFPPKAILDESATLEQAGLLNASVTQRWC